MKLTQADIQEARRLESAGISRFGSVALAYGAVHGEIIDMARQGVSVALASDFRSALAYARGRLDPVCTCVVDDDLQVCQDGCPVHSVTPACGERIGKGILPNSSCSANHTV